MLTQEQLKHLKDEYAIIHSVDPTSSTYVALQEYISKMEYTVLKQIADEDIKFLSPLVRNEILRRNS